VHFWFVSLAASLASLARSDSIFAEMNATDKDENSKIPSARLGLQGKTYAVLAFAGMVLLSVQSASADESCDQCKYLRCLKSSVELGISSIPGPTVKSAALVHSA
jgi:hypothetical protein